MNPQKKQNKKKKSIVEEYLYSVVQLSLKKTVNEALKVLLKDLK